MQYRSHPLRPLPDRPSRAVLDLGTLPAAPGCARAWTCRILLEWQLTGLLDSAELIVSELVTNAVLASRPQGRSCIRLSLTLDQGELGVFVRDYCRGTPQQPTKVGDEDENGRGLLLVEAMSSRSGWYPPEDGVPGKVVWAALAS